MTVRTTREEESAGQKKINYKVSYKRCIPVRTVLSRRTPYIKNIFKSQKSST